MELEQRNPILVQLMNEEPEKRLQLIKAHAYGTEEMVYEKSLTQEEKSELKDEYVQNNIKRNKIEKEFDKLKEDFKSKVNSLKLLGQEYITQLSSGTVQVEGEVFLIDDQENGLMITVDPEGNVLGTRPLRKSERQLNYMSITQESGT